MKHLLLKVYSAELDENHSKVLPVKELINKTYLIDIDFDDIQNYIIKLLGEGFRSESNSTQEYSVLSVYVFWERDLTRFKDYFSKFKEIHYDIPLKEFGNITVKSYIQIEAEGMDLDGMNSIMNIIRVHNKQHKVIKGTQIFEKGASGFAEELLIALTIDITKEGILLLIKQIKAKLKNNEYIKVTTIDIKTETKSFLLKELNLSSDDIYLSYYRKFDNGDVILVYKTKDHTYRVNCNKKGDVINFTTD